MKSLEERQKILIVDDSKFNQELLMEILGENYQYILANDGLEAISILQKDWTIDLMFLDINMPKMNGIEFLKIMRENEKLKNISVFVMTTSNEDSDKINAYNLNVAGYILKPLSFEKFLTSVATLKNFWQLCEM